MALAGKVVATRTTLNADKNMVVQVLDSNMGVAEREGKGRVLSSSLRSVTPKANTKKPVGLSKLMDDLNSAEALEIAQRGSSSYNIQGR
ncbi:hypothetical protein V6N12_000254, partial [Hibiscus sabdariffa]